MLNEPRGRHNVEASFLGQFERGSGETSLLSMIQIILIKDVFEFLL